MAIKGPFDRLNPDAHGGHLQRRLAEGDVVELMHSARRFAPPTRPHGPRYELQDIEHVSAVVKFNHDGKFVELSYDKTRPTFEIAERVQTIEVYFVARTRVKKDDPVKAGDTFYSEYKGVHFFNRVEKDAKGQLWIRTWDSNEGKNFHFEVDAQAQVRAGGDTFELARGRIKK